MAQAKRNEAHSRTQKIKLSLGSLCENDNFILGAMLPLPGKKSFPSSFQPTKVPPLISSSLGSQIVNFYSLGGYLPSQEMSSSPGFWDSILRSSFLCLPSRCKVTRGCGDNNVLLRIQNNILEASFCLCKPDGETWANHSSHRHVGGTDCRTPHPDGRAGEPRAQTADTCLRTLVFFVWTSQISRQEDCRYLRDERGLHPS